MSERPQNGDDETPTRRGVPLPGDRLQEIYGHGRRSDRPQPSPQPGRQRPAVGPQQAAPDPREPATPVPSGPSPTRLAVLGGVAALALLMILAFIAFGGDGGGDAKKDTGARPPAKRGVTKPAVEQPQTIDLPFRQLKRGYKGSATLKLKVLRGRSAHLALSVSVPHTQYEVFLVKRRGSPKRLLLGRDGTATWDNDINIVALTQNYEAFEVLALRIPHRSGNGRRRSLRITTAEVAERLLSPDER